jgi:hypothetical protein
MASVRTTVMKMKHDASRLSPLVERVPSDVHLLLFDRLGSPRVLYPLLNLTEDESGSEPTCCPQPRRPIKECLGSTFNVSEEENRGIHLFRLLVSNPSLFVRAHDRGTRAREDTTFSFSIAGLDIGGCCEDHRETQIPSDRTCDVDRIRSTAHIIKKKNYEAGRPGHQAIKHYYDHQEIPTKPTTMLGDPSMLLPRPGEV